MIMRLPIQDRRAFIQRHNVEEAQLDREINGGKDSNTRKYEGESLNTFARIEQNNKGGGR